MDKPKEAAAPVVAAAAKAIEPRPVQRWRARIFQGYLITATAAFAVLLVLASQFNYFPIDLRITQAVQYFNAGWFANLMAAVSYIGYSPQWIILVAAVVVLLFAFGLRWEATAVLITTVGATAVGALIKVLVHRPRPGADLVTVARQLGDYSFPSGHVLSYTAFFGILVFLAFTLFKPSAARAVVIVALGSQVALIGLSRIYLGNHWASDVAGAYLLGSIWLAAGVGLYQWGKPRFFVRQPLAPAEPQPGSKP